MLPKSGMPMLELSLRICFNAENSKPEISWMLHAVARVLTVSLTIIWVSSGKQVAWLICQTTSASCAGVPVNTCSCSSNARRWNAPLTQGRRSGKHMGVHLRLAIDIIIVHHVKILNACDLHLYDHSVGSSIWSFIMRTMMRTRSVTRARETH